MRVDAILVEFVSAKEDSCRVAIAVQLRSADGTHASHGGDRKQLVMWNDECLTELPIHNASIVFLSGAHSSKAMALKGR